MFIRKVCGQDRRICSLELRVKGFNNTNSIVFLILYINIHFQCANSMQKLVHMCIAILMLREENKDMGLKSLELLLSTNRKR